MASAPLNKLEASFADIAARNRLTTFAVAYSGEQHGPRYRFHATGHFDDAAEGQIPCDSGDGATIEAAIREMLGKVDSKRRLPLHGSEALYGDETELEQAA